MTPGRRKAYNGIASARGAFLMPTPNEPEVCPICQGAGIVTYIDEEVCCRVEIPCWACTQSAELTIGQPSPDAP